MSDKKRLLKIIGGIVGGIVLLTLLGFLALRIYAKYGGFDLSYRETTWQEYLQEDPREILTVKDDRLEIKISDDLLNSMLAESLSSAEQEMIQSLVYRSRKQEVYLSIQTGTGLYPVMASARLFIKENILQIYMEDFRLGDQGIGMPESVLGENLTWEIDLQSLVPEWIRLKEIQVEDNIILRAEILWDGVAERMQPLLGGIRQEYLEMAVQTGSSKLLQTLYAESKEGGLSAETAQEIFEDFLSDQSHLYSVLAVLQEDAVTEIFIRYGNWLKEEPKYTLVAQMQAEYELQVRVWVAHHMLQELQEEFAGEESDVPMYGVQGTPYHPVKETLYDAAWIRSEETLMEIYRGYLVNMRFYLPADFQPVMLDRLNEEQILVVQQSGYFVKDVDDITDLYPQWERNPQVAVSLAADSPERQAVEEVLCRKYEVETVHVRWIRHEGEQAFCIFSVGTETVLRAVMLEKDETWRVVQEDVVDYSAYFAEYPETNGSLFPIYSVEDVYEKKLTSGGKSQLLSRLRSRKVMGWKETIVHYSYIGSYIYLQTDAGQQWVVQLTEQGGVGECLTPEEALARWALPPFLCDAL